MQDFITFEKSWCEEYPTSIKLKLSPPWVTFVSEIEAMFANDPKVAVLYDNENTTVKLFVDDAEKASAIDYILPDEVVIGNVTLKINVVPSNDDIAEDMASCKGTRSELIFEKAFDGNPVLKRTAVIEGLFSNRIVYIVFKKEVVQFFNDNLNDIDGKVSTLYQEIAADIFDRDKLPGVCYCTEARDDKLTKPLGEWP